MTMPISKFDILLGEVMYCIFDNQTSELKIINNLDAV